MYCTNVNCPNFDIHYNLNCSKYRDNIRNCSCRAFSPIEVNPYPCPFCGAKPYVNPEMLIICCNNPKCKLQPKIQLDEAKNGILDVVKVWNTRCI